MTRPLLIVAQSAGLRMFLILDHGCGRFRRHPWPVTTNGCSTRSPDGIAVDQLSGRSENGRLARRNSNWQIGSVVLLSALTSIPNNVLRFITLT